jgi:hypothetical protein
VLDAVGVQTVIADKAGCCGAVKFHLNDQDGGKAQMRANIDAWWPLVERGEVEAIVMNASGCGVTVKEYGHLLRLEPQYADKAARISALTRDLSELLPDMLPELVDKLRTASRCHGLPWPTTRPARCSMGRNCAAAWKRACASWGSICAWRAPNPICAAALPAPTRCCSPRSRTSCATARSPHWTSRSPRKARSDSLGQYGLHRPSAKRHRGPGHALGGAAGSGPGRRLTPRMPLQFAMLA